MDISRRPMGADMTSKKGRAGLTARLSQGPERQEAGHMADSDGLGADPLPPKQAAKLKAMRRWAWVKGVERLPGGRLKVTYDYLGLTQVIVWANE
jgi:hypothetical protein